MLSTRLSRRAIPSLPLFKSMSALRCSKRSPRKKDRSRKTNPTVAMIRNTARTLSPKMKMSTKQDPAEVGATALPRLSRRFSLLSDAEQQIDHELVEFFVWQSLLRQFGPVEVHRLDLFRAFFGEFQRDRLERRVGRTDFGEQRLNLFILAELPGLLFEDQVISHATGGEIPDALFVLAAIGVRVEMPRAFVALLFEHLDQEEEVLDALGTEAKVLIEARAFLVVQVDVEELAGFERLRDYVVEVQARHLLVADLRVDADHFRVIERVDETQVGAGRREVDVAARLVRLGFERELVAVALRDRIFAEEVHRLAEPLYRLAGVSPRVDLGAFATPPEDVYLRAYFGAEVHRAHGFLNRVKADARVVRGERAVLEDGIGEEIRGRHRDDHPVIAQSFLELADDLVAFGGAGVNRHEVVVVEVDAVSSEFGKAFDDCDGRNRLAGRLSERIAPRIPDRPDAKREVMFLLRLQVVQRELARKIVGSGQWIVGSGQWIVGGEEIKTTHYPLPTTNYTL